MNTDTPETDAAESKCRELNGCVNLVFVDDMADMERERDEWKAKSELNARDWRRQCLKASDLERERDEARKWSATLADAGDELRAQLREEQQLHVKTLDERDAARETSWFSNGIEYRKRNDYIEARNNLNPHWVVVDSQTNQKP